MRSRLACLLLFAAWLSACNGTPDRNTVIMAAVWSDLSIPTELDSIRIDVTGSKAKTKNFTLVSPQPGDTGPLVKAELVLGSRDDVSFLVTATGIRKGIDIVSQSARVSFTSDQALLLKLFLGRACQDKTCPGPYTCRDGLCDQPIDVPILPPYNPNQPLVRPDAGVDSGTADADGSVKEPDALDSRGPDRMAADLGADLVSDTPVGAGEAGGTGGTGGVGGTGGTEDTGGLGGTGGAAETGGTGGATLDARASDVPRDSGVQDSADAPVGEDAARDRGGSEVDAEKDGIPNYGPDMGADSTEDGLDAYSGQPDWAGLTDSDGDGLSDAEEERGWDVCVTDLEGTFTCRQVKSSSTLPDSDYDGLPDVFEFAIRSDPSERDTDGDRLSDLEEFDIENPAFPLLDANLKVVGSRRYYDRTALDEAKSRCSQVSSCKLASTTPTRTNPNAVDSDGDGRSDYEETADLVINVDGKFARFANSNPNLRDTDSDGLDDKGEFALGTDPTSGDTDADGVSDLAETVELAGLGKRNPLARDKVIGITYTQIGWTRADCDTWANEEWLWTLGCQVPADLGKTDPAFSASWSGNWDGDTNFASEVVHDVLNANKRFLALFSESFALKGAVWEDDSSDGVFSWEKRYDVGTLPTGTTVVNLSGAACGGSIRVAATISVE